MQEEKAFQKTEEGGRGMAGGCTSLSETDPFFRLIYLLKFIHL